MARYVRFETVKRLLMAKRDSIPLTVVERYSFGCPTPNEHGASMRGGVNAAIKCLEEALSNGESVDIVRCEKCVNSTHPFFVGAQCFVTCSRYRIIKNANGFCDYGEKKANDRLF